MVWMVYNKTFVKSTCFFLFYRRPSVPTLVTCPVQITAVHRAHSPARRGDVCRICHCESEPGMPLISPCVCAGSLKYVHQACLQQWIKSADTKSCELCKYNFQMTTRIKPFRKVRMLLKLCSHAPSKLSYLSIALLIFLMLCVNSAIGLRLAHF